MNKEDKELLLRDLSARLPYSQKIYYYYLNKNNVEVEETRELDFSDIESLKYTNEYECQDNWCIIVFKPYLRPLSSMTEEEYKSICKEFLFYGDSILHNSELLTCGEAVDWMNAHHFDYRGLIEKGLALVAPEGMYKF